MRTDRTVRGVLDSRPYDARAVKENDRLNFITRLGTVKMKDKNILLLLEGQVDKIVLAVCVLVSLFLLWVYVIGNPYGEKVRVRGRERKLGPSKIDQYVKQEAEAALHELDKPTPSMPYDKVYLSEYKRLLQSSISEISSSVGIITIPDKTGVVAQEDRIYALPRIPSLIEVAVGNLRGAAQIPTEEIGPDNPYDSSASEIGDIDLLTVSARFDAQTLYNNFRQSFMGPRLKTAWKDDRLAAPVFARLEVERRTLQDNDGWGQWEVVPRTVIDPQRKLFEELPLVLDDASDGVDIWKAQYEPQEVQYDILQPEAYLFTVSRSEWMAPEFLDETMEIMRKKELEEKRARTEELRNQRSTRTTDTRRRTATRRPESRDRDRGGMSGYKGSARPSRAAVRKERGVEDVQKDFEKELLTEKSSIRSMRDSLLVWAHDDTTQPGKTYQYRIRIGVFNPIAGKDWFQSDQVDYKNQLVLWSDYSEPTAEVSVPKRIYVFPMDVMADKNAPNDVEGVQVEVAKYYLGQWWDFDFDVYPGEVIGYEVEDIQERGNVENVMGGYQPMMGEMRTGEEPDKVDFTSDITFVDVAREVVWGSRLRPGALYKMLYYDAERKMQQTAVGKSNWNSDTRSIYDEIQEAMAQGVEQRSPGTMPGMMGDEMMPGIMLGF